MLFKSSDSFQVLNLRNIIIITDCLGCFEKPSCQLLNRGAT